MQLVAAAGWDLCSWLQLPAGMAFLCCARRAVQRGCRGALRACHSAGQCDPATHPLTCFSHLQFTLYNEILALLSSHLLIVFSRLQFTLYNEILAKEWDKVNAMGRHTAASFRGWLCVDCWLCSQPEAEFAVR